MIAVKVDQDVKIIPDKDRYFPGGCVCCPICGWNFVHFGKPEYRDSHDNYEAWKGRGDAIVIPMRCENGDDHRWEMWLGFHKGETFIFNTADSTVNLLTAQANIEQLKEAMEGRR